MDWFIYIVRCKDDSLYTGITNNLERRVHEHNGNNTIGSRYVRSRKPAVLVYHETVSSRSEALKREAEIKKLPHLQKIQLIAEGER